MSKIKVEDIRKAAIENGWELISTEYKNLSTELTFICNEGHEINIPYKKVRDKWECPLCKANKYYNFSEEVKPKSKGVQRAIGLDQATHITGYSIFDNEELVYAGTFEATAEDEIARDVQIQNWLIQLIHNWKPDVVGLEGIQLQPKVLLVHDDVLQCTKAVRIPYGRPAHLHELVLLRDKSQLCGLIFRCYHLLPFLLPSDRCRASPAA